MEQFGGTMHTFWLAVREETPGVRVAKGRWGGGGVREAGARGAGAREEGVREAGVRVGGKKRLPRSAKCNPVSTHGPPSRSPLSSRPLTWCAHTA